MESLIAVLGTLLGAIVGVAGTYLTQRSSYRRESEERLATARRHAYVDFLTAVHDLYTQVVELRRVHREDGRTRQETVAEVRLLSAREAQARLESLRLLASELPASRAAALWDHLRGDGLMRGQDLEGQRFRAWRDTYWLSRRRFIDAARLDTGLDELDWSQAAAGPSRSA
ncbi:hypothetical protein FB561_3725 [Kribbella amoyensis]|uniref:Uncharacterized protein n=1 Tax=Kribbella amoyensis TaxID=996641 RepID=A0A561BUJ6_9ACTN|nr:hypothetical protein FB561_3725 [Kribbella amoyensis]